MSDWWADRLAGKEPTQKTAPEPRAGSTPPLNFRNAAPAEPPPTVPTPQAQYMQQQQSLNPELGQDPSGQITMGEAIRTWQGGEAHRKEAGMTCPECGSTNVFGRVAKGSGTAINGSHPAPRCYECGWNGLYDQGMEANWVMPN